MNPRVEKPGTSLALFDDLTPDKVYTPGGVDAILRKIVDQVRGTVIDVSTKPGRDAAKSLAYKVARSKTLLDDMGKDLVADWKAKAALVDAERKTIRDRLDALKAEVSNPVDEWEAAETERLASHTAGIMAMQDLAVFVVEPTSAMIADRITMLGQARFERDWQEFDDQASETRQTTLARLAVLRDAAIKREADAAELEALRAEKAERERKDREAQEAREAKERDRLAHEERWRILEEATARAVEAERQRVADQEAAERSAAEKRERNKRHRAKVIAKAAADIFQVCECDLIPRQATCIVEAIAAGKIPNITISF